MGLTSEEKKKLIEPGKIPISRQCKLLDFSKSAYYYKRVEESELNLELMKKIDEIYTKRPFYGYPRITGELKRLGYEVNRKRVYRLMIKMGLQAVYPKKNLSKSNHEHKIYPYLLRGKTINKVNQVWGTDITYISMLRGFLYLVAIMDWFSRYVVSWVLSNTLEVDFCLESVRKALEIGKPEIENMDQGSQFTSEAYTGLLLENGIKISMDGRGRAFDNIFNERLWRSLKYEEVYLKEYDSVQYAKESIDNYFNFYNKERIHQSLDYKTPAEVYFENT